ncbi:Sensory box/GGDEF family protein [Sinorhizobium alkalisoli]|nr:Sensory box/GGDEF family protein [Sinorhizobium alkalisoli]
MPSQPLRHFRISPPAHCSSTSISRLVGGEGDVVERLVNHLKRVNIAPSSLCFELSERFDNGKVPDFSAFVRQLRLAGFKLAIDDFGAGFNGLRMLCDQPVDYVKIDRHFITGIDRDSRKRHLVRHAVNMAHVLGTRVIAEGVETEVEFLVCRDLGCDLVQGYFVARPTTHLNELRPVYAHLELGGRTEPFIDSRQHSDPQGGGATAGGPGERRSRLGVRSLPAQPAPALFSGVDRQWGAARHSA